MDDNWILIGIILFLLVIWAFGFTVGRDNPAPNTTDLKIASNSADIRKTCDRDYGTTSFKDTPIKCLQIYDFMKGR